MDDNGDSEKRKLHERFAVSLFNLVWELLDRDDLSPEERDRMVHAAHASRFHWGEVGTPLQLERGEWQISRVYSVLGRAEPAVYHAKRCLDICEANSITDFDLAFAYEAMARAYSVAGEKEKSDKYVALARRASERIEDDDNREYFQSELKTV
jgi:hypothetical protein